MLTEPRIVVQGKKLRVEWAVDARGRAPALLFFEGLTLQDRQRVAVLFKRLAEDGDIASREHFKSLGKQGRNLWEFKRFQIRFLGDFRPGGRFMIAHGVRKKKDELGESDIEKTVRILAEHDERERREREATHKADAQKRDRKEGKR